MLRVSANINEVEIDLQGINGDADSAAVGVRFGGELMQFAEMIARADIDGITLARQKLTEAAGQKVVVDAAGVAANFQRMVRIADAMGIPVDNLENEVGKAVRDELAMDKYASAKNSLR